MDAVARPSTTWSLRCAQRVVPVRLTQRQKRKWTFPVQSPGGRRELAALAPVTNHRPYGEVAASCLAQSRAIIPNDFQIITAPGVSGSLEGAPQVRARFYEPKIRPVRAKNEGLRCGAEK